MVSVVPQNNLTLSWDAPQDNGCLAIQNYTLNRNGTDLSATIYPTVLQYTDIITSGGIIGDTIVYKLKANNLAGSSPYTNELTVTVGSVPNAPTNLIVKAHYS